MRIEGTISRDHIAEVVAIPDPILRNLWITQTYHELANAFSGRLGGNVSWLAFAVWASKTAGQTIRNEELPALIRLQVDGLDAIHRRAHSHTWLRRLGLSRFVSEHGPLHMLDAATEEMSALLAKGNTLVFAELAPIFSGMLEDFEGAEKMEPERFEAFLAKLPLSGDEDAPRVRRAFTHYYQALFEEGLQRRAELVLAANCEAVLHEQRRLQPQIAGSMDAALKTAAHGLFVTGLGNLIHNTVGRVVPVIGWAVDSIAKEARSLWERAITEFSMALETPSGPPLDLGEDVPAQPGQPLFPEELSDIELDSLVEFLAQWDRTNGTGVGSAASDWRILEDRMNYITNLFRSRQRELDMLTPPFSQEQLEVMRSGRVPSGPL